MRHFRFQILFILAVLAFPFGAQAQIQLSDLQKIIAAFHAEYDAELAAQNSVLYINRPPSSNMPDYWWDIAFEHASYSTYTPRTGGPREHNLFLFGGYARIRGMTQDQAILTLCHELGHGIGGEPLKKKRDPEPISTEGQSDYFSTRFCAERIFKQVPANQVVAPVSAYVEEVCAAQYSNPADQRFCWRGFQALEVERMLFRVNMGVEVFYERKDPGVVTEVEHLETFYPAPQCRLDTLVAGLLKQERPRCWWAPSTSAH